MRKRKRDNTEKQKEQTPVTSDNTIDTLKNKKKRYNISKVTCFNCHRKGYYISIYTKPSKN